MGDLSDDLAFSKMWDEAADEYVKSTRKHRRSPPPSTEDVLAMIQEDQEEGSKREEHRSNVRAVLDRVVVIGEFAAGGASAAFPPSELCSTAIFYLVQTAWVYGEQKTAIANLFSEMTTFLECFNIYANAGKVQERIDIRLKSQIRRLLQCFIWVCGRYTAVANEPALMRLLKAGIRYDNGVKDKLSEIQSLSNKISEMRDTRTHVQVLNTDMAVESLQNVQMQKMEQKTSDRWQETIKKALNIDDAQLGWHETQNAHLEDIEDSTGSWLFERDDFRNWAGSRRSPTPPVFALEAGDGYGRSYLCAAIINYLQQTPPDPGFKTFAGFYYFDKDEKDTSSMKKALRAIIWQLSISKGNKAFTRCFADKCEDSVPLSKPYDLWQHSVMECSQPGSQIFIVIDGIGHASEDYWELAHIIRDVLSFEKDRISIRLLLTGAKADLEELRDHLQPDERSQITSLTVTDHNKSDLRQFISKRMRKVSKSWEPNSDNEDFREEVVEGLLESTDGDYEKLNLNLEDISQKVGKEEIRDVLKRANEPREETIKREVDRLEKTLGEREIDSLNEVLPWIILPRYDWPSLKQLKAVIFLQHGKKPLMSLQKLIQEKYAPLLVVDGRLVRSYSTLKYFKKERGSQVSKETEAEVSSPTLIKQGTFDGTALGPLTRATTFNNTSRVHEVEVALVKRLLSTVCDEDLFAKFGFTDFFMRLQNHSGKSIHFERVDGHARIIHTCLKALCSQDKRSRAESEPLVDYAITNLRWHLSQIDLPEFDHASTQKRGAIGKLLYNLFMDKNCIEAWLTPGRSQQIRQEWLTRTPRRNQKTLAEEVFKSFRDPDVVGGIGPHGRERINSIIYGSRKSGDLFREATKAMASNWLLRQDWDVAQTLWWILGFIQDKTENNRRNSDQSDKGAHDTSILSDHVFDAENWAGKEAEVGPKNVVWDVRVIDTLMRFQHNKEALEEARKRNPNGWMEGWCAAREQHGQRNYELALATLNPVIRKFRSDSDLRQTLQMTWKEIIYLFGSMNEAIYFGGGIEKNGSHLEAAHKAYMELLDSWPDHFETVGKAIHCMKRQGDFHGIIQLLKKYHLETTGDKGRTLLTALFIALAKSPDFHHDVAFAASNIVAARNSDTASNLDEFEFVKEAYRVAVKTAESGSEALAYLRFYYGLTLWYQKGRSSEEIEAAIYFWEQNVFEEEMVDHSFIQRLTSFKLSSVYLQLATGARKGSASGWGYVKKLEKLVKKRGTQFQWTGSEEILLARAYHLSGYKNKAKALAAKHVGPALAILDDNDPENDWEGFVSLSNTLGHMDDDINALAAKSLIGPLQRDVWRNGSTDNVAEMQPVSVGLKSSCDNLCGRQWTYADDMRICRDCIRTIFCGNCLEKLKSKDSSIEYRVCDPDHDFLVVPKWERPPKDQVRVDGKIVGVREWLNDVKSVYDV